MHGKRVNQLLKKLSKEQLTILIIMITEVLGFSLILPFLPFFAMDFGASVLQIGLIAASFSFFQFFSGPIMGKLSDHYGRKPLLLISQFSTFTGFLLLAFASNIWMILLSRIIDGLFGSNFVIAEAYLADISKKEERSKAFALSGVAFGIGFLLGPITGGVLSFLGMKYLAFFAASVSLLSIFLTITILKETVKLGERVKINLRELKFIDSAQLKFFFTNNLVSKKMYSFFFFILSNISFISVFSLFVQKKFNLRAQDVGFILAYVGLLAVFLRIVIMPLLLKFFTERKVIGLAFLFYISAIVWMAVSPSYILFMVGLTFYILGTGLLRPMIQTLISVNFDSNSQGALLGVTNSFTSISQIIGPALGGLLLHYFMPQSVLFAVLVIALLSLLFFLLDIGRRRMYEILKVKMA